jgi:DNA polymerase III epsilon subunit-like protein
MKELWSLLDSSDYVIGHNVDGFDVKKVNNRFIILGMDLPYQYKTVDTLKLSRKYFPFESNGLDYIAVKLGGRPKLHIDFDDWRRVIETGDVKTLAKVSRYCNGDVREGVGIWQYMRRKIEASGKALIK